MMQASRRAALLAGLGLPGLARAQPGPSPLRVLLTIEGTRGGDAMLNELIRAGMAGVTILHEDPSWIAGPFAEAVEAGDPGVDVVLANVSGFAQGAARDLWQALPAGMLAAGRAAAGRSATLLLPRLDERGVVAGADAGGPVLLHRPTAMPRPPRNAAELLDFARQNPRRFQYARPRESRLGEAFVAAIPYLVGDADPRDPLAGWSRSWPYLEELGRHVAYYPSSGTAALDEFNERGVDLMPALLATFALARRTGEIGGDVACAMFDDIPLQPHASVLSVPRGVAAGRLPEIAALLDILLTPRAQAWLYGRGLLGSVGQAVPEGSQPLSAEEREAWIGGFSAALLAEVAVRDQVPPLAQGALADMLRLWDQRIGARFGEAGPGAGR